MLQGQNQSVDYFYLRPPNDVYNIKHDEYYIKHGEGNNHMRKIFFKQKYDQFEEDKIKELEQAIQQEQLELPPDWCREMTLKYVYSGGFNVKKCLERLKKHLEWRKDPVYQVMSPEGEEVLKKGYAYAIGRDKQYRPILYIQLHQVTKNKVSADTLLNASTTITKLLSQYMFVPGFVETWNVIIDLNGSGLTDTPFSVLQKIVDVLSINYTSTLNKMFILNPSFFFHASWKLIEKLLHPETAAKIQFLKTSEYHIMQQFIDPKYLEEKYGGTHPNLTKFWPIPNPFKNEKQEILKISSHTSHILEHIHSHQSYQNGKHTEQMQISVRDVEFHSVMNDSQEFFQQKFHQLGSPQNPDGYHEDYRSLNNHEDYHYDNPSTPTKQTCCSCIIF